MVLYLVQHGEAFSAEEDPERGLNDLGGEHARMAGRYLRTRGVGVETIWHSGKLRAKQTAEILAAALQPGRGVLEHENLNPSDDPKQIADDVERSEVEALMIVGHMPHLSRLATLLLGGAPGAPIVRFRNAGVVALDGGGGAWSLVWAVPPQLFGQGDSH